MIRHLRLFRLFGCTSGSMRRRGWSIGRTFLVGAGVVSRDGGVVQLSADRLSRAPAVKGWTFEEMVFLYGFSLVPLGVFNVFSWNLYLFADRYLIEGASTASCSGPSRPSSRSCSSPSAWSRCRRRRPASSRSSGRRGGSGSSSGRRTSCSSSSGRSAARRSISRSSSA